MAKNTIIDYPETEVINFCIFGNQIATLILIKYNNNCNIFLVQ